MNPFRLHTKHLLAPWLLLGALLLSGCDAAAVYSQLEQMAADNQQATAVADHQNRLLVIGAMAISTP
ncbi:MAG: hypothetical protein HC802_09060 [Caldilineaceae bacterium]|nr:hypothetical protein [Caldilineaceae bacterium]